MTQTPQVGQSPEIATIVLTSSSWVVDRGEAKEWWEIERDDEWIVAWKHPRAAEVEQTDDSRTLGPGQIWRCATELQLPVGTRLKCVRTSPRVGTYRDAMDYLKRAKRDDDRLKVVSFYILTGHGRKVAQATPGSGGGSPPRPSAGDAKKRTARIEGAQLERARQRAQMALSDFERELAASEGGAPKHRRPLPRARAMTTAQAKREADRQLAALRRWEQNQTAS